MSINSWQPSASLSMLQARAVLYDKIRTFFAARNVLEVDVPLMAAATVTDPHIDSIVARNAERDFYLQSSPEFAMKRLLAAGSGCIYSLGKAFRNGELGRRHNPEFTMLEWYRTDFDDRQLMEEVAALVSSIMPIPSVRYLSYREWFETGLGIDPHTAPIETLIQIARQYVEIDMPDVPRDAWLDVLVSHVLEPQLEKGLVFIYHYPASQAALAKITTDEQGQPVARRFEAFLGGMELANGYWELTDATEQAQRFARDQAIRQAMQLPVYPQDELLLQALQHGLPACAGVALGVDRLLMCQTGAKYISEVLAFPL